MSKPLKILQISTADVSGGAERVALDLHRHYLLTGHDATLAVGFLFQGGAGIARIDNDFYRSRWERHCSLVAPSLPSPPQTLNRPRTILRRLAKSIGSPRRAIARLRGFDDYDYPGSHQLLSVAEQYDIVHLHNLHGGYFDLRILPELSERTTTCLTAHDMWLATGHCAYSVDCSRWKTGCGRCPHLDYPPSIRRDGTVRNWQNKRAIYSSSTLHLVGPAKWIISTLESSVLAPAIQTSATIANGVDCTHFHPKPKHRSRLKYGIPDSTFVVAFMQAGASPYKDALTIEQALPLIRERFEKEGLSRTLAFLHIGAPTNAKKSDDIIQVPYTTNTNRIAEALSASDVYIHSSRAETLPLSILEAQACGIPVIVSDVGGASESFLDGKTGILVSPQNPAAIANACVRLVQNSVLASRMRCAAIEFAKERTVEMMGDQYLDFYHQALLSGR